MHASAPGRNESPRGARPSVPARVMFDARWLKPGRTDAAAKHCVADTLRCGAMRAQGHACARPAGAFARQWRERSAASRCGGAGVNCLAEAGVSTRSTPCEYSEYRRSARSTRRSQTSTSAAAGAAKSAPPAHAAWACGRRYGRRWRGGRTEGSGCRVSGL